jgi:hypothetical protein
MPIKHAHDQLALAAKNIKATGFKDTDILFDALDAITGKLRVDPTERRNTPEDYGLSGAITQ